MGKEYYKFLGVNKAANAGGGNGKRLADAGAGGKSKGTGGIPLTGKDCYKSHGINKPANSGGGDGAARANPGGEKGAGGAGCCGWGGASPLSPTDHSTFNTAVKVMNQHYHEEENGCLYEDERSTFSSTHITTTIKTDVKVANKEENRRLSEDGDKESGKDMKDDIAELLGLADEENYGAEMGYGGDYNEDAFLADVDEYLNGDAYYYDVAAAGFDYCNIPCS